MRSGARRGLGYGIFKIAKRDYVASRVAVAITTGVDPLDLCALHSCDYPPCVRGCHLFTGTPGDNATDRASKGRSSTGDSHYARTNPEKLSRGDTHWSRLHPERRAMGERHGNSALTWDKVREMRLLHASGAAGCTKLARLFLVSEATALRVINRQNWKLPSGLAENS